MAHQRGVTRPTPRSATGRCRVTAPKRAGRAVSGDYQIFPAYSPDEFAGLKESIGSRGVLVPIVVDQHGTIIDGHHRKRAYDELIAEGAKLPPYERKVVKFASDDDRLAYAVSLNERRRQLTPEQRKKVARTLRQRGWSLRKIADELGAGSSTIKRDLAGVPHDTPAQVIGKDGRRYAANRPPTVSAFSEKEEKRAVALMGELGDDLPRRETTVKHLETRAKKRRVLPSAPPDGSSHKGPRWRLDCADMREWKVRANSVDLIVTDPPYEKAGIHLYKDLSAFAARALKPGGLLFAYAGLLYFDQIFDHLRSDLRYVVEIIFLQTSRQSPIYPIKVDGQFRPVLVFSKGKYEPTKWMNNVIVAHTGPEKDSHPWQQSLDPVLQLLKMVSDPGDLVCDPFTCTGTTGDAALMLGRKFLGCEIDPRNVAIAKDRLAKVRRIGAE